MEKILQKMARQLNSYDEASLMSLWEKYYTAAKDFQPTKNWEEAVLVLGFIQTLRWKKQLFNHHWSAQVAGPGQEPAPPPPPRPTLDSLPDVPGTPAPASGKSRVGKSGKVLSFRPRKKD